MKAFHSSFEIHAPSVTPFFISIVQIFGEKITWLVPHAFPTNLPNDVDFRVMGTFVEFYRSFLKFVNFKLYNSLNLVYPPKINLKLDAAGVQLSSLKLKSLNDNTGPSKADIANLLDTQKVNFSHLVSTIST
jgi:pescadillo protein